MQNSVVLVDARSKENAMINLKKAIPVIAISCLFLVVFNVLEFILVDELNEHFW